MDMEYTEYGQFTDHSTECMRQNLQFLALTSTHQENSHHISTARYSYRGHEHAHDNSPL